MTDQDRGRFAAALTVLGEVFARELSPTLIRVYFDALLAYPIAAIEAATAQAVRTLRYFPKPAELIEAIEGSVEDRGAFQWAQVLAAMRYSTAREAQAQLDDAALEAVQLMGGWKAIDHLTFRDIEPVEIAVRRKEFLQLYRVTTARQAQQALTGEPLRMLRGA